MKKVLTLLLTLVCAFALAACGGAETDAESADVTSTNGVITVTPAEGFTAEVSKSYEMITLQPEGADSLQSNYIEI